MTRPTSPKKARAAAKQTSKPADTAETEDVDLEAALGGGIRKAPAAVAALDEAGSGAKRALEA